MTEPRPNPAEQSKPGPTLRGGVGVTRFVMVLAVISIFAGSTVLLLIGTFETFNAIWHALTNPGVRGTGILRSHLIETVDTFLVAVVLYVIAVGLYQLFVNTDVVLPRWLRMSEVGDLENRLVGMVVSVLAVVFVTHAIEPEAMEDLLPLGLSIAAVIAAIALFLYQEGRHRRQNSEDD